jgi:hypothetical protein
LNNDRVALFLVYHFDYSALLQKYMKADGRSLDVDKLAVDEDIIARIDELGLKTHAGPWRWQELDDHYLQINQPIKKKSQLPTLLLRGSISDLWLDSKHFANAKGVTLSLSNNNLSKGHAAWNSEGVLGFPQQFIDDQSGAGSSLEVYISLPTISWKIAQVQGSSADKNTEELNFSIPVRGYISNRAVWSVTAKPYYQTDFSFGYGIWGGEVSAEPNGEVFGSSLHLGSFANLGTSQWQYQIRVVPKIDWSGTSKTGVHTSRVIGDDWLRAGGLVSLEFRLGGVIPDVGVSYETLQNLSGQGKNCNLLSAYGRYWLNEHKDIALSLNYSKGSTLVANKKIDLLTFGLEWKK